METKVVLLGSGTPNTDPRQSGPSVAIVVGEVAYVVDCGPGVVRRAVEGYHKGIEGLKAERLKHLFITHLHSDHTAGLADFILSPWVMERNSPVQMVGPVGTRHMVDCILDAYKEDIHERLYGFEQAQTEGIKVELTEIPPEKRVHRVYADQYVKVDAIPVHHGSFAGAYAYKFYTPDKVIVISGDTNPNELLIEEAKGCDILLHEAYYTAGLAMREEHWQKYHSSVHTSAIELGEIAQQIAPKLLVVYHQLYMMDINTYTPDLYNRIDEIQEIMLSDIKKQYTGKVKMGKDVEIYQ